MGSIFDITAYLRANTSQFTSGMKNAGRQSKAFSKQMNLLKGQLLAVFSVGAVVSFSKASLQAYDEQIKADTKLLTAMKGREDAMKRMGGLASQLQGKTLFSDEQSVDAMARMAAIMGDNEDAIKKLLPLVQDFATVKGMDLASAAELITKTFASSTNALQRYGIQVEGSAGSVLRLNSLMTALNKNFAGQSVAAAKVGIGSLTQLKNAFNDLQEVIGEKLMPAVIGFSAQMNKLVTDPNTQKWAGNLVETLVNFVPGLAEWYKQGVKIQKQLEWQKKYNSEESSGGPLDPKTIQALAANQEAYNKALEETRKLMEKFEQPEMDLPGWMKESKAPGEVRTPITQDELWQSVLMDFEDLKEEFPDDTEFFESLPDRLKASSDQVKNLTRGFMDQNDAVGLLSDSFMGFFTDAKTGWQNMLDTFSQAINRFLAEQAAKALLKFVLNMIAPGSGTAVNMGLNAAQAVSLPSVSSQSLDLGGQNVNIGGEFKISGNDLKYAIRRNS